jgi:hypothetical protein
MNLARVIVVAFLLLAVTSTHGGTNITWRTEPPASGPGFGSPAHQYEWQIQTNGEEWAKIGITTEPVFPVEMPEGVSFLRVRAIDVLGRAGPWSPSSEPYEDLGPPSGCSAPWI